jgi:NADH-quinone oxidoreductase subunit E
MAKITNMLEQENLVKELADKIGRKRENLMPILQGLIEVRNYLTDEDMVQIAKELDISAADVYGTASFYSFMDTVVRGKYVIRICKTISCSMKGKLDVLHTIEDTLKIKVGETTSDKRFSLLETNCIGWCHKAPAMLINDTPYTELTPQKVTGILQEYIKKD